MKLSQITFIFLSLVLLFSSCNLDTHTENIDTTPQKRISQIYFSNSWKGYEATFTVDYDNMGRVIKVEPDNFDHFMTTTCEYNGNMFRIGEYTGMLNHQGYIKHAEGVTPHTFLLTDLDYNDKGELISKTNDWGTFTQKWKNGNMIEDRYTFNKRSYATYTEYENKAGFAEAFSFFGGIEYSDQKWFAVFPFYMLLGKPSKNLPEKIGGKKNNYKFSYVLDDDGYVKAMVVTYPFLNGLDYYRFEYEDVPEL